MTENPTVGDKNLSSDPSTSPTNRPRRMVVIWDIHGVVLSTHCQLFQSMKHMAGHKGWIQKMNTKQLKESFKRLRKGTDGSSSILAAIARKHNNEPFAKLIVDIENARNVKHKVVDVIRQLRETGVEHIIGSNISKEAFTILQSNTCPEKFRFFSELFTGTSGTTRCNDSNCSEPVLRKPNPRFFTSLLEKNGLDPKYDFIVFVDDKLVNLKAAHAAGIKYTIHCKGRKRMCKELIELIEKERPNYQARSSLTLA